MIGSYEQKKVEKVLRRETLQVGWRERWGRGGGYLPDYLRYCAYSVLHGSLHVNTWILISKNELYSGV